MQSISRIEIYQLENGQAEIEIRLEHYTLNTILCGSRKHN